jgi:hypothetical protein
MGFHIHFPHIHLPHVDLGKALKGVEHDVSGLEHKIEHEVASAARAVGKEARVVERAVGRAVVTMAKKVGHLSKEAEHWLAAGVGFLGHDIMVAMRIPAHILQEIALAIGETVLQMRPLRRAEIDKAGTVYQHTVPYNRVLISRLSGASSRPFTVPGSLVMTATATAALFVPGVGTVFLSAEVLAGLYDKYVIFLGPQGYQNALNHPFDQKSPFPGAGQTFIHELTHVWQGHNQAFPWEYVYNSCKDQCMMGSSAYDYDVTNQPPWKSLHVEAQARLVQNWFALRMPAYGTLYSYVRDNVRGVAPNGATHFTPPPPGQPDPGLSSD